jgi:hypothetical protein
MASCNKMNNKEKIYTSGQTNKLHSFIKEDKWESNKNYSKNMIYLSSFRNAIYLIGRDYKILSENYLEVLLKRRCNNSYERLNFKKDNLHIMFIKVIFNNSLEDILLLINEPFINTVVKWRIELGI